MRFTRVIAVGSTLVAAACGSSSSGGSGGTGGGGGEGTAQGFVTDFCNLVGQCCSQSGVSSSAAQGCESQVASVYLSSTTYTESIEGLGFGNVYNPIAGQACIQALEQASSQSCLATYTDNPACANVFACSTLTGTKGAGDTCACNAECIAPSGGRAVCYGGAIASDGGVQSTGTCVQLTPGAAGQGPCLMTIHPTGSETNRWTGAGPLPAQADLCDTSSGVWCDAATQQCTALGSTGQSCTQDWDCVAADYCPTSATGGARTCAARIADGASCAGAAQYCLATSYCDSTSQTCQPQLANGAACKAAADCQGGLCSIKTGSSGTCGTKIAGSDICLL
jgi:hypothetical protein